MIVDLSSVGSSINLTDVFFLESKPEFDEGFNIDTDMAEEEGDVMKSFYRPLGYYTIDREVILYDHKTQMGREILGGKEITLEEISKKKIVLAFFENDLIE